MLILYDGATTRHDTVEFLGAQVRPALESPDRITTIVAHLRRLSLRAAVYQTRAVDSEGLEGSAAGRGSDHDGDDDDDGDDAGWTHVLVDASDHDTFTTTPDANANIDIEAGTSDGRKKDRGVGESIRGSTDKDHESAIGTLDGTTTTGTTTPRVRPSHATRTTVSRRTLDLIERTHESGYIQHLQKSHETWVRAGHIASTDSILPECFPFSVPQSQEQERREEAGTEGDQAGERGRGRKKNEPPSDLFAQTGWYAYDMSTGIMADTYGSAVASAQLAVLAASLTHTIQSSDLSATLESASVFELDPPSALFLDGATSVAKCAMHQGRTIVVALCRPPGHHCDTRRAGGYCYINNAVLAVEHFLLSDEATRDDNDEKMDDCHVGVLDLDFHHGNGTQNYFYGRRVAYVSIHDDREYPYYSGAKTEFGIGMGRGYNHNIVVERECGIEAYLAALKTAIDALYSQTFRGDGSGVLKKIVISLGLDTLRADPLGHFALDVEDYRLIAQYISSFSAKHETDLVVLLEGGYVVEKLGACVENFCRGLADG